LVFVVHIFVKISATDLTEHFGKNLGGVAICCFLVTFFAMFLTFCLEILETVRKGDGEGGRTSTDNTTRWDCSEDVRSRRKYIDTPPSSIALII
jgi:hypothetical protein